MKSSETEDKTASVQKSKEAETVKEARVWHRGENFAVLYGIFPETKIPALGLETTSGEKDLFLNFYIRDFDINIVKEGEELSIHDALMLNPMIDDSLPLTGSTKKLIAKIQGFINTQDREVTPLEKINFYSNAKGETIKISEMLCQSYAYDLENASAAQYALQQEGIESYLFLGSMVYKRQGQIRETKHAFVVFNEKDSFYFFDPSNPCGYNPRIFNSGMNKAVFEKFLEKAATNSVYIYHKAEDNVPLCYGVKGEDFYSGKKINEMLFDIELTQKIIEKLNEIATPIVPTYELKSKAAEEPDKIRNSGDLKKIYKS